MTHAGGFRHDRLRRRLSEFLDGTLDARAEHQVGRQLERCPACRAELESLRETVHLLQALGRSEPPPDLAARVMARIEAGEADPSWRARAAARLSAFFDTSFGAPLATGAAALVVFAVVQDVEIAIQLPSLSQAGIAATETPTVTLPERSGFAARPPARDAREAPLAAATSPLADRHRRELSVAATQPQRPVPSMEDCLHGRAGAAAPRCAHWHALMVDLGLRDARAFLAEVDTVPGPARERWIGEMSAFASDTGSGPLLAHELRATGDPRGSRLAPRFERATLSARR